jgi:hypothetical protein
MNRLTLLGLLLCLPFAASCSSDDFDWDYDDDGPIIIDDDPAPPDEPVEIAEDCTAFDWQRVEVRRVGANWKLTQGARWIKDFGSNRAEAARALDIIRHYKLTQLCYVSRANARMTYFLASGRAPGGRMVGEDAVPFDWRDIRAVRVNGRWKVADNGHNLIDFGASRADAEKAAAVIRKYRFDAICFVGRPNPSMMYFRRDIAPGPVDDGDDFVFVDINPAGEKASSVKRDDIVGRRPALSVRRPGQRHKSALSGDIVPYLNHVSDGVNIRIGGPNRRIDCNATLFSPAQPCFFRLSRLGPHPNGKKHHVGRKLNTFLGDGDDMLSPLFEGIHPIAEMHLDILIA